MQCIIFAVLASVFCLSGHLVPHQMICNNFAEFNFSNILVINKGGDTHYGCWAEYECDLVCED